MEVEEVKSRAVRSVIALTARTVLLQVISLVAFFLLGIFLSPSAVGVFIAVSALMRIFTLFTDVGLGAALIQKKESIDQDDLKTTFTLQTFLILCVVSVGFLLTPEIIKLSALDTSGVFLYHVLLVTLFISSLKAIPSILLERRLAFETQIIPQIAESLAFNIIVVACAYKGLGVASYAWAILISALVGLPIYYLLSPWKVSIGISVEKVKHLLSYGLAFQGKSTLAVIKDDLLTFVMTIWVGSAGIGYWGWAQRWAYSPFRLVVDSITKVTFPAYARVQHDISALRSGIEQSLFAVSLIMFPILTAMSIAIGPVMNMIPKYQKWEPSLVSFYFLCAAAAVSSLSNILVNTLDAVGHVKTTLGLMIGWIVSIWVLTITLVKLYSFTGISIASFLVTLSIVLTIYLTKRVVKFSFLPQVLPALLGILGMVIVSMYSLWLAPVIYFAIVFVLAGKRILYLLSKVIGVYHK